MRLSRVAAALAAAAIAIAGCGGSDDGRPPEGFFGVAPQEPPSEADLARMQAGGVESYHLVLSWPQIERTEGTYDWGGTDELIERLSERGIRAVPYIFGTPTIYADETIEAPRSEQALGAFDRFAAAAAARYGTGGDYWEIVRQRNPDFEALPVRSWEIWNEVNGPTFWSPAPSPKDYGTLLRVADGALRRSDPEAKLISAGMFATPAGKDAIDSFTYLRRLFSEESVREIVDFVGVHPYGPDLESVRLQMERTRRIIDRSGAESTGLWVTEIGWGSDPGQGSALAKTPVEQAALLGETYEMLLAEREGWGVEGALWYTWRDPANQSAPGSAAGADQPA